MYAYNVLIIIINNIFNIPVILPLQNHDYCDDYLHDSQLEYKNLFTPRINIISNNININIHIYVYTPSKNVKLFAVFIHMYDYHMFIIVI